MKIKNANDSMKTERLRKSGLTNSKYVYPLNIMKVVYLWKHNKGKLNNLTSYSTIECNYHGDFNLTNPTKTCNVMNEDCN